MPYASSAITKTFPLRRTLQAAALATLLFVAAAPSAFAVEEDGENQQVPPNGTVTIIKEVVNDEEDTVGLTAADFHLFIDETEVKSGVKTSVAYGGHSVSETENPLYEQDSLSCVRDYGEGSEQVGMEGNYFYVAPGADYVCTITNDDLYLPGYLAVRVKTDTRGGLDPKEVTIWAESNDELEEVPVNDSPITRAASVFLALLASPARAATAIPLVAGVPTFVGAGSYTVFHSSHPGYTAVFSGDCSLAGVVPVSQADIGFCTITFKYNGGGGSGSVSTGLLNVITNVINDDGGVLMPAGALMTVATSGPTSAFGGIAAPGIGLNIPTGGFTVTSPAIVDYGRSESGDCTGTMAKGGSLTCTVTYNDLPDSTTPPTPPAPPTVPPTPPAPPAPAPTPAPPAAPPAPVVLGVSDTDDTPPTALPRTGGSPLMLLVSALAAAAAIAKKKS